MGRMPIPVFRFNCGICYLCWLCNYKKMWTYKLKALLHMELY